MYCVAGVLRLRDVVYSRFSVESERLSSYVCLVKLSNIFTSVSNTVFVARERDGGCWGSGDFWLGVVVCFR